MRTMVYTNKMDNQIISHENHMLVSYIERVKKYAPFFAAKGYSLKVGLMWAVFPRNTVIFKRERFQNGYQCYVYCAVLKDGVDVCIDSSDGEADYYSLSTAWMVSSIFRRFSKLNVTLSKSMDEVDVDLNGFLSHLK